MGNNLFDDIEVYFSGANRGKRNGMAFNCSKKVKKCVMGFNLITDI